MAFPLPVPSLTEEEFAHFHQKMDEFDVPEEIKDDLEKHRDAHEQD